MGRSCGALSAIQTSTFERDAPKEQHKLQATQHNKDHSTQQYHRGVQAIPCMWKSRQGSQSSRRRLQCSTAEHRVQMLSLILGLLPLFLYLLLSLILVLAILGPTSDPKEEGCQARLLECSQSFPAGQLTTTCPHPRPHLVQQGNATYPTCFATWALDAAGGGETARWQAVKRHDDQC